MDTASFADVLFLIRSLLPDALIDDRGWERLRARAGHLPPSAADAMFGFECRLDDPEASADLLLTVPRESPFADALVRQGAPGGPQTASLAGFLPEVRRPSSPLSAAIDLVALEYDVVGVEGFPAPGVFLRSAADGGYADAGLLTGAIAQVAGWKEERTERNGVARILDALPRGAAIRWAGVFPDRRKRAVRLLVRALADGSAAFLSRIGWTENTTAIDRIMSAFGACGVDNHVLAIDIAEGRASPKLGLELSRREPFCGGWMEPLDTIPAGVMLGQKKTAAARLATRSELIFSRVGVSELHYGVHHVKLGVAPHGRADCTYSSDCIVGVKAYIACVLRPLP